MVTRILRQSGFLCREWTSVGRRIMSDYFPVSQGRQNGVDLSQVKVSRGVLTDSDDNVDLVSNKGDG